MSETISDQIKAEKNWYKKALIIYTYHNLMELEFGTKRGQGKWGMLDTAASLQIAVGAVCEAIKLVNHYKECKEIPDSQKTALALMRKK